MSVSIIGREIETILERVDLESLRGSRVLITGATGFIGSMLIRALLSSQKDIKVIAMARSREKACQVFGEDIERIDLVLGDITEPIPSCAAADYIIHTASVTASKYMVTNPVETIEAAVKGTANVLDFARDCHAKSVVYLSSMEVYGVTSPEQNPVTEEKLGYIDLYNPRSCYSEGKRLCENMCCAYTKEFNVPVKVARLANTFGPGVSKNDNRLFMQLAKSVIKGSDIVLHTRGESTSNFCYINDCIAGIFTILLFGKDGEAYNVCNDAETRKVREIADMVAAEVADGGIEVVYDIPKGNLFGYAADTSLRLSSEKLRSLGWEAEVGMAEAYMRLIDYITEQR